MNHKGFSLVELIVVLVILALLMIIAVPIFINGFNTGRNRSDRASRDMIEAAARDFANNESISMNRPITLCRLYRSGYIGANLKTATGDVFDYRQTTFTVRFEGRQRVVEINNWVTRSEGFENNCGEA